MEKPSEVTSPTGGTFTKLMWGLGQGMDVKEIADFFNTDVAGEVTLD